ncbi:hypothetical protein [Gymnodinialimonas ceratoperidinii]|uniref:Uncharacterized protein n=1 Tax=Gymnodinialimonas ceratoperidinii TaxID=2856823 RepID=A0A8F6TXQ5_9RHOB|nr:hypothetical protein [Gymnodinialimonas ceratoperidinii]QXT39631.1 hypothetical protein KYE46_17200 [Gymnodinialimonas ceratoperidinii]
MTKEIDPDLFARLMRLSSDTRKDLLEYLGQSAMAPIEAARVSEMSSGDRPRSPE